MLRAPFYPDHVENRMKGEGDVALAREHFLEKRPNNLSFLLAQRYGWMNRYLTGLPTVIELGAGAGFSKEFITTPSLRLTDVSRQPWIDEYVDAMALPYTPRSVDALICSHMIHHVANPKRFFRQAAAVLRPGGVLLIQEIHTSLMMRALLRVMRHEGWSYAVDVFDESKAVNDPKDPWSANCAVPEMLFEDVDRFEREIPELSVELKQLCECLIFPLSGGVIAKSKTIQLPKPLLQMVHALDEVLTGAMPKTFALGMRVVLRKRGK